MFIAVLFLSGLIAGLVAASLLRRARGRLALAVVGIATWIAYAIFIEEVASCPAQGECDKGIGVLLLATLLVGWLGGVATSWVVRRPHERNQE